MKIDQKSAFTLVDEACKKQFGCSVSEATKQQAYKSLCIVIKDILIEKNVEFTKSVKDKESKQVYYCNKHHKFLYYL